MSIRHYFAELLSTSDATATYRFTPDSITKKYWGIVEFDLATCEHKIEELAPDLDEWGWPQDFVCVCLARKLKQQIGKPVTVVPAVLEWVS